MKDDKHWEREKMENKIRNGEEKDGYQSPWVMLQFEVQRKSLLLPVHNPHACFVLGCSPCNPKNWLPPIEGGTKPTMLKPWRAAQSQIMV